MKKNNTYQKNVNYFMDYVSKSCKFFLALIFFNDRIQMNKI